MAQDTPFCELVTLDPARNIARFTALPSLYYREGDAEGAPQDSSVQGLEGEHAEDGARWRVWLADCVPLPYYYPKVLSYRYSWELNVEGEAAEVVGTADAQEGEEEEEEISATLRMAAIFTPTLDYSIAAMVRSLASAGLALKNSCS